MLLEQKGISIRPLSDSALVVQLDKEINSIIHKNIMNFVKLIEEEPFEGFVEAVPCYNNVTIFYNPISVRRHVSHVPFKSAFEKVSASMMEYLDMLDDKMDIKNRLIEIPVVYGEEFGPDLEYVARFNNITPEKVIELHTKQDYLVYMIGFAPGFPFLGGIDKRIATPRKEKPRLSIPAGSVGIAGEQTGMYPLETPGGWQVIGKTPIELFTPKTSPPTYLQSGDKIRFIAISKDDYLAYKEPKQ